MLDERASEGEMMARTRLLLEAFGRTLLIAALVGAILFGGAGRFDWPPAWSAVLTVVLVLGGAGVWMAMRSPELLEERLTASQRAPRWDRVILAVYRIVVVVLLAVAAVDAGRFGWSRVPAGLRRAGSLGMVAAALVVIACIRSNRFLSSHARVQSDRQQRVVSSGPYRYVRHPMYTALIVMYPSLALAFESWLALLPAAVIGGLFVLRTALEDRMLRSELEGYADYAAHVRYRLIPAVW